MENSVNTGLWSKKVRFFNYKNHLVQITKQTHTVMKGAFQENYIIYKEHQPQNGDIAAVGVGASERHAKTTENYCMEIIENNYKKVPVVYQPEFKDLENKINKLNGF